MSFRTEMQLVDNSDHLVKVSVPGLGYGGDVAVTFSTVVYEDGMRQYKTVQMKFNANEAKVFAALLETAAKHCG